MEKPNKASNSLQAKSIDVKIEKARRRFPDYIRYYYPEYKWEWFQLRLAEILDGFVNGNERFLIVQMPPGHSKTELCTKLFSSWYLGKKPNDSIIFATYGADFASEINDDIQKKMDTPEYRKVFPDIFLKSEALRQEKISTFEETPERNTRRFTLFRKKGFFMSAGVGGPITGKRGKLLILDDPIKNRQEADSEVFRNKLDKWFTSVFRTRAKNQGEDKVKVIIVLTRWHEDDVVGRILKRMRKNPAHDQYKLISFPAIKQGEPSAFDPRQNGEALSNYFADIKELRAIEAQNQQEFNSLYMQNPGSETGNIIKREYTRRYKEYDFQNHRATWCISADFAFKKTKHSDFVAIQVWCRFKANVYLVRRIKEKMTFTESKEALKKLCEEFPWVPNKLIELKANGDAIMDSLQDEIPGLIGVTPTESKEARCHAVSPFWKAGNVLVPEDQEYDEFLEECYSFPNGVNDDEVDAMTQALRFLYGEFVGEYDKSMVESDISEEQDKILSGNY